MKLIKHQWIFRNQLPHSEAAVSDGTLTVGVGQDDVWTLPSELQSDLLQVTAARRLLDQVTHLMDTNHMKKAFIFRQKDIIKSLCDIMISLVKQ